jgi:hypothetical protein
MVQLACAARMEIREDVTYDHASRHSDYPLLTSSSEISAFFATLAIALLSLSSSNMEVRDVQAWVCEDVAAVAAMLAMNGYMTGQTFYVNGGRYMT